MSSDIIFKPRFNPIGWILIILLPLILLLLFLFSINSSGEFTIFFKVAILLLFVFLLISLFFLLIYPTMKYILVNGKLILRCGPFKDVIKLEDIKNISKKNLIYHTSSMGWKLPGYTLFKIYYPDQGYVNMYATGMLKDILLIETENQVYGITPKDEKKLIEMINHV
jgi:Zn-dependent protease with chaperone function